VSDAPTDIDTSSWNRLPARMLLVHVARLALALIPLLLIFGVFGSAPGSGVLVALVAAMGVGAVRDLARHFTTRYLVDEERVQLRTGLLTTSHLSIPRERIRAVDVIARPLHRMVRLAVVQIGTGEQARSGSTGDLTLDAIDTVAAEDLRRQLLARAREPVSATGGVGLGTIDEADAAPAGEPISTLKWRWIGWSVLSWWTLALPAVLFGSAYQLLASVGVDPLDTDIDAAQRTIDDLLDLGIIVFIAAAALALLAIGIVARLATFVETWWGFELRRESDGTIRMRRGLFTARSTSLQELRIRGVTLSEPILLRAFAVGSAQVVTTGLAHDAGGATSAGNTTLGPPAPIREIEQVVTAVLEEHAPVSRADDLRAHPVAALRRRLVRAAWASVSLLAVALAARAVADVQADIALVAAPPIALAMLLSIYAFDTYRALGHRLTERYVVMRRGSINRRTVALERAGVIGWIGSRTFFQRRVGLMTLQATTAAGAGAYSIVDIDEHDAAILADAAVPNLLTPFLQQPT
jgi:putative membrane protein